MKLSPKDTRKIGLNEETLRQIKKRIRKNRYLVLRKKTLIKFLNIHQ